MHPSNDKAARVIGVATAALLVPLLVGIAFFTDAFSSPAVIKSAFMVAGGSVGFGAVYLLTLSRRWGRPVAGLIVLMCGLLSAGLLWLLWTFSQAQPMPAWTIRAAEDLPKNLPEYDAHVQVIFGIVGGAFSASLNRLPNQPCPEQARGREVQLSLLAIGGGLVLILALLTFSGS